MLLLRAAFLEFLLCAHVIGAAVLFRRLFPRESVWFGFFVPPLAMLIVFNFIEHFITLQNLGWLLPITLGGLAWAVFKPGYSWDGLRFPSILFVALFTFTFGTRYFYPEISNANEGMFNYTRILNYTMGGTLPPRDVWMPPYDYGNYYSFQHYGAAIISRLFNVDVGTAYNLAFAFVLAWICLMGAAVAHSISGRLWISLATVLVLLSASTGSVPFILLFNPLGHDYTLSTDPNINWDQPDHNPFAWLASHDLFHYTLVLEAPLINLYWPEYHATLGGNFVTIASMLAVVEVFRPVRQDWPWICAVILPLVAVVTSAWFFFVIFFMSGGAILVALLAGRRPENWRLVAGITALASICLWPFFLAILSSEVPATFRWTSVPDHTPVWMFLLQWWPIWVPWLFLCCIYRRLDLKGLWLIFILPVLFIVVEFTTFGDRKLTTEKLWAGLYGAGLVTLLPLVFMQARWTFRVVTCVFIFNAAICLWAAQYEYHNDLFQTFNGAGQLDGAAWVRGEPQRARLLKVMQRYHGAIFLPGRSYWNYSQAAAIVSFSGNQCWVAYTINEIIYGRGEEVQYRNQLNNRFFDGGLANPLPFLRSNNIDAVLIWPEDLIPDDRLARFKKELGPEFYYIDCKGDGATNAGVFVRQESLEPTPEKAAAAALDYPTQP